jgi:hypothetical protein
MLVFIDDSGDPGFRISKGSSKSFVISLVIFDDNLEAEKTALAIKELKRTLKVPDSYEFKFNKSSSLFKSKFIDAIKKLRFRVRAIVVQKETIQSSFLRNNKENFYNYVIMQVLKNNNGSIKNAKLKFDKRGEKAIRDQLRTYLSRELDNKSKQVFNDLKFVDSKQNTLIQLADMIAGSIYSSYSGKNVSYLKTLRTNKLIEDIWLFK